MPQYIIFSITGAGEVRKKRSSGVLFLSPQPCLPLQCETLRAPDLKAHLPVPACNGRGLGDGSAPCPSVGTTAAVATRQGMSLAAAYMGARGARSWHQSLLVQGVQSPSLLFVSGKVRNGGGKRGGAAVSMKDRYGEL